VTAGGFGAERAFRIERFATGHGEASAEMPLGAWLEDAGRAPAGALAVLVDDVLGYAAVSADPAGRASVSSDIALDLLLPLPRTGRVRAVARCVHAGDRDSAAIAEVLDDGARVMARAFQRGRWVDSTSESFTEAATVAPAPADLRALLGVSPLPAASDGTRALRLGAGAQHANGLGALHGGLALCASQLAASDALAAAHRSDLVPTSIRIAYPRPGDAGRPTSFAATLRHAGRSFAVLDVVGAQDGRTITIAHVTAHASA